MQQVEVLKIFLASPSDVAKERDYVIEVIEEINRTIAPSKGVILEVVSSKHTFPGYGQDGQSVLNKQIGRMKEYEIFLGIMWSRVGTPTQRAPSGTIEEFKRAVRANKRHEKPDIWFYFRKLEAHLDTQEKLEQAQKVVTFKTEVQRKALTHDYNNPSNFRDRFRQDISLWLNARPNKTSRPRTAAANRSKKSSLMPTNSQPPTEGENKQKKIISTSPTADNKRKKTTTSTTKKRSPAGSSSTARTPKSISSSGALVMLNDNLFLTESVDTQDNQTVTLHISPTNSEQEAALRKLQPEQSYNKKQIPYAYQDDAAIMQVESVVSKSLKGKTNFILTLSRAKPTYYNYRICVVNRDRVQVEKWNTQHQDSGQPSGVFRYEEKLEEITPLLQIVRENNLNDPGKARALGEALFDVLFDDVLRQDFFKFYHQVVQQEKQLLRVELDIDERRMPEVAALPWEFLCLPVQANLGTIWMGTLPELVFSRRRSQSIPAQPIQLERNEKLKIALVVSAPLDLPPVAYESVQKALEKLAKEPKNRIKLLPIVNSANPEVIDTILSQEPHIFHFIGHGRLVNQGDHAVGQIALVDPDFNEAIWVDADYFSELFNLHRPGVVMLQPCEGGMLSASQAFVGVASSIIQQSIPTVVAMQYEVTNNTASRFARRFYQLLAADHPVDIAAQYGRRAIALGSAQYRKRDFAAPVIFMRVQDGRLFKRATKNKELPRAQSLFELLQQCTVMVCCSDKDGSNSIYCTGFFVAPGRILTVDFVVDKSKNNQSVVKVFWQNREYTAEIDVLKEDFYKIHLLIIRVDNLAFNHPCVYLDDSVEAGDSLYTYFYRGANSNGESATFQCLGLTGDELPLLMYATQKVASGSPGAPLLNLRTGKVCGFHHSAGIFRDNSSDIGSHSRGTPASLIFSRLPELVDQQQEFYQQDKLWTNLLAHFKQASEQRKSEIVTEATLAYGVSLAVSSAGVPVGGELEVAIVLRPHTAIDDNTYLLEVPCDEAVGGELNILLNIQCFRLNGDNTASLPLDPGNTGRETPIQPFTQTARFRLTAIRPGIATITAELYRGDTFETNLEAKVQVAGFDEASFTGTRITTQPRPAPQPDFILRVQTAWKDTNSACKFHYQLRSFRFPSLFPGETNYHSESLSSHWIEQMRGLLEITLENISDALPEDGRSHLTSLGQYLFQNLLPPELQNDLHTVTLLNRTFTLLILADQDASLPWELLHDGQQFLSDRFIIGRWFWELNDTRPHEFPVGAINVAHYADIEQPELWAALLEPPGASPPLLLPEGVLGNLDSTEAMRGLHLIRYSQSADAANRGNAPVTLDDTNNAQDIDRQMRPAKLNLRRNRPLVSLGYVRRDRPELTTLEQTWASAFIRAGCSAFTGSLWAVDLTVEAAFISGFYNRLWTGDSLGEAFHTSRQLARAVAPDSLDWLAYVLFGDPMARPYRPVEGKGYAVVEPIGREIDDLLPPGVPIRFRLSLRRTPPVWHEDRVIEVAENLTFENLQAHVKTFGLQVTPDSAITMSLAPTGNYLGWFTLFAPPEMAGNSALVQVFLMDGMQPIHSLMFSLNIENKGS